MPNKESIWWAIADAEGSAYPGVRTVGPDTRYQVVLRDLKRIEADIWRMEDEQAADDAKMERLRRQHQAWNQQMNAIMANFDLIEGEKKEEIPKK